MKNQKLEITSQKSEYTTAILDYDETVDLMRFDFAPSRREFVGVLGAGLLIAVCVSQAEAQERPQGGQRRGGGGFRGGGPTPIAARLHIGKDGLITVLTGKVECGQGARAEITQAAAEELRVPASRVTLVMADTALVPNDGTTAGSGSTPRTLPAIRQATAAARNMLLELAAKTFGVKPDELAVADGKIIHKETKREKTYADLASAEDAAKLFGQNVPANVTVTRVNEWQVMGKPLSRPNGRDLVTGAHHYPSDISRPGMLHGKILRTPSYGAKLSGVDVASAKAMKDVTVVQDGNFVAVAAPTTFAAEKAIEGLAKNAKWDTAPHPSSKELYDYLRQKARGGIPANPFADDVAKAAKSLKQSYNVAYVQHAPMEPRAAVAEWTDGKLTVWTATQNPFGVRGELANAFRITEDKVRVIVPDFGGGFGGKHSGECAVETAKLAQAVGKPVSLRWTREEEFTWAYFRPAAAIDAEAALDASGAITSWYFININSGGSAVESPYRIAKKKSQSINSEPPLRHGSYRALASTANNFARESFMDELAAAAGKDPLEFRLAHLEEPRLRAVLQEAARKFNFTDRWKKKDPRIGVGLACGVEKASYVAACCEVAVDPDEGKITVRKVCQAYECGAIVNPANLKAQVQGAIIMGLGPALREEMKFANGKMLNAAFSKYLVPRMEDVPELEIHLLNRPDVPSVGAGETPIICIAPAIANAVFHATGQRIRQMPIKLGVTMATHAIVNDIYLKIAEFLRAKKRFALAVVMKDAGSTPRKAGTKAIIDEDGSIWGTIGGGLLESDARKMAVEAIRSGKPTIFDFKFSGTSAAGDDPVCGGNMRILIDPTAGNFSKVYFQVAQSLQERRRAVVVRELRNEHELLVSVLKDEKNEDQDDFFNDAIVRIFEEGPQYVRAAGNEAEGLVEPVVPPPLLLIGGGGHVGQALARQAQLVGFEVVVIDDREEFSDRSLFGEGIQCRRGAFRDALFEFPIDQDTYIALVGRGHKVDSKALLSCLNSPAAYIGMMGSRRKVALVKKEFIEGMLIDEEGWKKIHAPIGLDIGAETVPEIAASIVAQMVAVRRRRTIQDHGQDARPTL